MAVAVGAAVLFVLILFLAWRVDRRDRRHGRKTRMRMPGLLEREGRVSAMNSPEAFMLDTKEIGDAYSGEQMRRGGRREPP